MRALLLLLPAALLAQTPAPVQPAKPKPAAAAKPATTPRAGAPKPAAAKPKPAAPALTTDEQKTIYALGFSMYQSLAQFDLSPAEFDILKRALGDAAAAKPALDWKQWAPRIQSLAQTRGARVSEREKAASKAFLDKAAAEPGAQRTPSGLIYRELQAGTGASPAATDSVKVHYRGTLVNGTEFDSSYKRNEPAQFPLNGVIRCWTEGVQKMKVGGKAALVCPSDLAYGDGGRPPVIPGGATLVFQIELLGTAGRATP